eukprot:CAMPEP_0196595554 /NCGR_PEP_ID=MMETSP1081-20130531/81351_1 /TAXON_ID=36882 /ORGANISM="Pyramimonas amylifera, Strain CCMP720" /LENGTH=261 /DNA_ID=CAMNT_0041920165 /DNA_START=198 /DNA_END=983 /DNA_ORIENTATION=-
MNFLSGRVKAVEGSYYHKEQERVVGMRRAQLEEMGLLHEPPTISEKRLLAACDALPEVLAHSLPINAVRPQKVRSDQGYYVHNRSSQAGSVFNDLTRRTYVDQITLGSTMNTGRSKWAAGTLEGADTNIWDIQSAQRLMLDGSDKYSNPGRLQYVVPRKPTPVVNIAGIPLKLLPDPTPGRALFWGTIICVWSTAAALKMSAKSLDIETVSDIKPKLAPRIAEIGKRIKTFCSPVKELKDSYDKMDVMESSFSKNLRMAMS